jgi:hypothetical protein
VGVEIEVQVENRRFFEVNSHFCCKPVIATVSAESQMRVKK